MKRYFEIFRSAVFFVFFLFFFLGVGEQRQRPRSLSKCRLKTRANIWQARAKYSLLFEWLDSISGKLEEQYEIK